MPRLRSVPLYLQFARCSFQRLAAYRLANWTGIAVNFFFFLIHAQVYLAFFGSRQEVSGWRPTDAVLYFATSEALLMVLGVISHYDLSERIRSGDVTIDLVRPMRLWERALAEHFGSAAYYLAARASVVYVGARLMYGLDQPAGPELLWLPISLALAIAIGGLLIYLAHALSFWWEYAHGPLMAMNVLIWFFGGVAVPLDFYPEGLRWVCDVLPFRAAVYTPVALASGRLTGGALAFGLLHQGVWLLLLIGLAHTTETRGVRRMVTQGG